MISPGRNNILDPMGLLTAAVCLLAAVGVGCRPVISPLNDAKVECIIQETLNEDGSKHECGPQLAAELDEVQRHQGLLGELQRLADDERERYEYNPVDEEGDLESESDAGKTTMEGNPKRREMDEPKVDDTGIHDEEERAKELEELLAEEISKKEKEERNDEELKELLRELKKKRYEMKERGSPKSQSSENGQAEDDTKQKMAIDKEEFQQKSFDDQRKDELELSAEKEKVEKELKELTSKNNPEEEKARKEKQEELDELVKKMQRVQDEARAQKNNDDADQSKPEEGDGKEGDKGGGENEARSEEGGVEMKEPQQKRVMEKASDEATRQFERERLKDQDDDDDDPRGEDEDDEDDYIREDEDDDEGALEDDEGEELLEIEAQLREVAAELRELRRG
ncbi:DNA ligase 1 [Syngnathus scovelli]|uniref:DNA ligase 1 n=1 Tax=Syngnathus scovelli TaxID=161590 RepID=UPI0021101C16|nr:DNA ligase 1 [Syngnathus scovelli]